MLKMKLKHAQMACKAIWNYRGYVEEIKNYIELEELVGASELWEELDYSIQKLLFTAPRYGGPFTTKEREIVKGFWSVSVEDIENG